MDNKLNSQLKDIDKEDVIWIIFILIFVLRMYSNEIERKYRIYKDELCRKRYHYINEFTYIVAIIIAIYCIYDGWNGEHKGCCIITNSLSIIGLIIFIWLEISCED